MPLPPDSVSVMDPYPYRVGIAVNLISFILYLCAPFVCLYVCVCVCVRIPAHCTEIKQSLRDIRAFVP